MNRSKWLLLSALLGASACETFFTEPVTNGPVVQVSLVGPSAAVANYGDLTPALRDVRYVRFRFIRAGETRDTVVVGSVDSGMFHARVTLRPQEARDWLEIQAELRMANQLPLFRGHALLLSDDLAPRASIELTPVAYAIAVVGVPTITALGDTVSLGGQALFANDLPIQGASVTWVSTNPSVVEVVDGDQVVSRTNGSVSVTGSALGATVQRTVTVRQTPVVFTGIGPADTIIALGASFQARPFGEDRNGYPLLPGAFVEWSGRGGVAVETNGIVTATATGTSFVDASFGGTMHTGQVTVGP